MPEERQFDLAAAWNQATARFEEERPRFQAILRLAPAAARWVRTWRTARTIEEGERPVLEMEFECEEEAVFVALGLGSRAEVVGPAALKHRIDEELQAVRQSQLSH